MILALDIGGTFIKSGLFDPDGTLHELPQVPSRSDGSREDIIAAIRLAVSRAGAADGIGIAIPGPFDYRAGISLMTHKFGALYGVDLRAELGLDVSCVFVHDADAFLMGELGFGSLRDSARVGAVTLGTGLGAAVAVDGATIDGELGSPAPKVSLWKTPFRGGIAEDFVSARALVKKYPAPGAKEIEIAARNGDAAALQVWREFGECLAELLSQWIAHWDLERVALGGQIAKAWEFFRAPLAGLPVFPAQLPDAALYGAFMKVRGLL